MGCGEKHRGDPRGAELAADVRGKRRNSSWRRFLKLPARGRQSGRRGVFQDTHRLILELVHTGIVDGLRIDHIDGLADPLGYLQRLRQATGPDCYITVEKFSPKGNNCLWNGRYPAPPDMSLSPRWPKCWSTIITSGGWKNPRRDAGRDGRSPCGTSQR